MITKRQFVQRLSATLAVPAAFSGCATPGSNEPLWTPRALTQPGEFTIGIEGPACDREGNIYAVNFARQQTIGKTTPDGRSEKIGRASCRERV